MAAGAAAASPPSTLGLSLGVECRLLAAAGVNTAVISDTAGQQLGKRNQEPTDQVWMGGWKTGLLRSHSFVIVIIWYAPFMIMHPAVHAVVYPEFSFGERIAGSTLHSMITSNNFLLYDHYGHSEREGAVDGGLGFSDPLVSASDITPTNDNFRFFH